MAQGIDRRTLLTGAGVAAGTALSLRERGAKVVLVDLYGPGNPNNMGD